ncbi:PLDc N-terminal domain-containing protein [Nocardioides sp. S5]|uniref:PLDc N-terminal domain-containing protein n=1 Tax=Nocardioides sp. S5 TaxID=2017486 RepID=UPI001A901ECC|nr:PLDc N-terminal domain-containing protein [Nocardioides sp. S5]
MTDVTTQPARTAYDGWCERRWRLPAVFLALAWLVVALAVVLAGEKRSNLDQLVASVGAGDVTRVEVVGLPQRPGWRGRTQVTLRWQGSVLTRFAEVPVDTRRRSQADVGDPVEYLQAVAYPRDLDITYSEHRSGSYLEWRDWRGPGWTGLVGFLTWFATLVLLRHGPEPRRATRWAWGWLVLLGGPLGSLAYLLLGGPLGVRRREPGRGRLTGGWAFLLALILFGSTTE